MPRLTATVHERVALCRPSKPAADLPSFLEGRSGETISAYSKDRTVADLTNKTVVVTVSFQGDERGGSFWVRTVSAQSSW